MLRKAHARFLGGRTRVTAFGYPTTTLEDGSKPKPGNAKDGEALIIPALSHAQETLEDVHSIVIELKQ